MSWKIRRADAREFRRDSVHVLWRTLHARDSHARTFYPLYIQLEAHVLLKIAKHARDNASVHPVVTGSLLGLDVGDTLEITECFAIPSDSNAYEDAS